MSVNQDRRTFLTTSSLAGAAMLSTGVGLEARAEPAREFYEWRVYELPTGNRKAPVNDYLAKAAIPAWNRLGIAPVGAFTVASGASNLLLYVLIPHKDLASFESAPERLAADVEYRKAAEPYLSAPIDNPAYIRYDSWLLRAFKNVPKIRVPDETAAKRARLFELRVYESHSEAAALKKIEMFNDGGEIATFDRVGIRSVFYGQTLAGPRQPNLVYMTVYADMAARDKAWAAFGADPGWKQIAANPAFADTVSANVVSFLRPTTYSQI
jgi:hypothetical protein